MRSRAPLALMEQLLMLAVFALAAAVCVRAFVLSDRISKESAARDGAVVAAQSAAEQWKSVCGSAPEAQKRFGGAVERGMWSVYYDADWNRLAAAEGAVYVTSVLGVSQSGGVRTAALCVDTVEGDGSAPLFALTLACQEAGA